jgi:hypothetical protein
MSNRSNSTPSPPVDRVLEFLATDTEWHTLDEISQETALPAEEVAEIVNFLAANKFISLNRASEKAKIREIVEKFMTEIREEEKLSAR